MRVWLATHNAGKVKEFRSLLHWPGVELLPAPADAPEAPEMGETFEANAREKAVLLARTYGGWALADDSGLEVDALGGAPGVHSARYGGEGTTSLENNALLLKNLSGVENRRARFVCVLALSDREGRTTFARGTCEGTIGYGRKGEGGFGYDPLFTPLGETRTFGEMTETEKSRHSHRAQAILAARESFLARLGLS